MENGEDDHFISIPVGGNQKANFHKDIPSFSVDATLPKTFSGRRKTRPPKIGTQQKGRAGSSPPTFRVDGICVVGTFPLFLRVFVHGISLEARINVKSSQPSTNQAVTNSKT